MFINEKRDSKEARELDEDDGVDTRFGNLGEVCKIYVRYLYYTGLFCPRHGLCILCPSRGQSHHAMEAASTDRRV